MADDTSKRGGQDRSRINTGQDYEVRYWTKELGVTETELKSAVEAAGNTVTAVRDYLRKQHQAR
jgi:uncharacterized protein DUF3606